MSKKITWHSGPPPSVGWWPASTQRNSRVFRWWDGELWSTVAMLGDSWKDVARYAAIKDRRPNILWTDRPASWPARSRT